MPQGDEVEEPLSMAETGAAIVAVLGVFALLGGGIGFLLMHRENNWIMERIRENEAKLEYEVFPIPPQSAGEFWSLPRWGDFSSQLLGNEAYSRFHEKLRRDVARYAAEYAGQLLVVRVRSMPCPT